MDTGDTILNITYSKKDKKKKSVANTNSNEYKFVSKPVLAGKTIARKRPQNAGKFSEKTSGEPQNKVPKVTKETPHYSDTLSSNLRDLSENKGKYQGKNYQELNDELQVKQKPRSGGWISSLFKNNPDVPRIGQRAVKPIVEKVFTGKLFSDLDIHPHCVANLNQNLNLKELMTVQQNAVPVLLQGRDALIRSQTGSGKTLAYALPIIEGLQAIRPKINRNDGIRVIVVVPTRELAVQTYELFVKLVKPFTWLVPGLLSGGQKRKAEKARLRKGLSILVGTPGRINDHLRHTKSLNFSKTNCLVLDEADRLLDMGYEKDVAAIVKAIEDHKKAATYDPMAMVKQTVKKTFNDDDQEKEEHVDDNNDNLEAKHHITKVFLSSERQTILLSATLTKAVESLAGITLVDPVFVDTSEGRALVTDSLKPTQTKPEVDQTKKMPIEINEDATETIDSASEGENKRGLKAFNGANHLDLLNGNKSVENNQSATVDDSDSDSDYEYFKVQKELEQKAEQLDSEDAPEKVNTFNEALSTAVLEDQLVLPASVKQSFLVVPMKLRLVTLCSLIVEHCVLNKMGGKMIVFMATLEMVDYHAELIETVLTGKDVKVKNKTKMKPNKVKNKDRSEDNDKSSSSDSDSEFEIDYHVPAEGGLVPMEFEMFSLHGSMPHEQRMEVFKQFRAARTGLLICTDVAARGIDVPRVDLVLQYCAPASATDYVHRVGRTGRAAKVGAAVLFLLPSEVEYVRYLEGKRIRLRQTSENEALESLRSLVPSAASMQRAAIALQARLEHIAHSSKEWLARASRAYTSWVRFYAGYPRDVREYMDSKKLHLGHAAKAFALRDTPGALAKRSKNDPNLKKERPTNRLTVHEEEEKKRPGFSKMKKISTLAGRVSNKQSSMHTASEFDSGLTSVSDTFKKKKKTK